MGRNKKTGLDYFPFDIDFFSDLKIRKLIKYQGGKAVTVYALLLCNIYRQGYYMRWDEELPFIVSELTGFEEAYIREVIRCCLVIGLFSNELYRSDNILTSRGIQERYQKICDMCRRNSDILEFNVVSSEEKPISSEEKLIPSEEKLIPSEKSTQRKEKEIKEKKKESTIVPKKAELSLNLPKRRNAFIETLRPYLSVYGKDMINAFFAYWSEPNKSGTKMRFELEKTWEISRRLSRWAKNELTNRHNDTARNSDAIIAAERQKKEKEYWQQREESRQKAVTWEEYLHTKKSSEE